MNGQVSEWRDEWMDGWGLFVRITTKLCQNNTRTLHSARTGLQNAEDEDKFPPWKKKPKVYTWVLIIKQLCFWQWRLFRRTYRNVIRSSLVHMFHCAVILKCDERRFNVSYVFLVLKINILNFSTPHKTILHHGNHLKRWSYIKSSFSLVCLIEEVNRVAAVRQITSEYILYTEYQ